MSAFRICEVTLRSQIIESQVQLVELLGEHWPPQYIQYHTTRDDKVRDLNSVSWHCWTFCSGSRGMVESLLSCAGMSLQFSAYWLELISVWIRLPGECSSAVEDNSRPISKDS